jgi:anti-sigma regulatory factor (Ser/Thr protein kinase)
MPHAEVTLPGEPSSVPTARRFAESILSGWGNAGLGWTAALCVSELATNVALHARSLFTVGIRLEDDGTVRLEVTDASARLPRQRAYGTDATTGRGLLLVDQLARRWGVTAHDGGKTVWVELSGEGGPGARDDVFEADEEDLPALLAAFDDRTAGPRAHALLRAA